MDENEAKSLASDWIRRVEVNVLSKVYDNTEPSENDNIVTNRFRHDSLDSSLPQPSPKEKIHTDTTNISSSNFAYQESDKLAKSTLEKLHDNTRTRTHSSRNSPRSPRVNLEILRRKRLEHFENRDWINKENLVNLVDELPDISHASVLEKEISNEFPFKNSENLNFKPYHGFSTQRSDEDDKLRLELWGLRGAVESGHLDIKSYIPSRFSDFSQNISLSEEASVDNQDLSYQETGLKSSSSRDCNHNLTSFSNNTGDLPILNSSLDNLPQLAMLSIETPNHGRDCRDPVFPKEDFTHFTVSRDPPFSLFGCPVPQIEGNLYNGFETSDSENSVNSAVLHDNSATKNNAGFNSNQKDKPLKSSRGKQTILTELTEFLGAERNSKKTNAEKENSHNISKYQHTTSKMHFPDELLEPNSSAVDFLLKSSSMIPVSENGIRSQSISPEELTEFRSTSMTATKDGNFQFTKQNDVGKSAHFYSDHVESSKNHPYHINNPVIGKVCPTCKEVNSQAANWCIECGTALISVQATILDQTQFSQYQQQHQETRKFINEALQSRREDENYFSTVNKKERELKQDIINLSKEVQKNSDFSKDSLQSDVTSYKRRWLKSSLAWSTYEPQELSKPPSVLKGSEKKELRQNKERITDSALRSRSSSDLAVIEKCKKKNKSKNCLKSGWQRRQRSTSATYHSADDYDTINLSHKLEQTNQKSPRGSKSTNHCRPSSAKQSKGKKSGNRPESARLQQRSSSPLMCTSSHSKKSPCNSMNIPQLNLDDAGSYDRILTLIRSQRDSDPVPYLCLPDEIILEIFSSLSNKDLVACACVCTQFYRIAMDETLWRTIVIRKNRDICDAWLESIGDRHPSSLTISQCPSSKVTSEGLRSLFRKCSESLEEVDFSGCSGGELIGESILLHISIRCFNIKSIDVSWTNVSDNGVQELAKNLKRVECLCLNGCQAITDKSLTAVSKRHGESLRIFEVFGCFNITPAGLLLFGSQCLRLQTLNIGQCHKMTDAAVGNLVSHLPEIENLDLRGCKQTRDSAVKKIVRNCPHLKSLVLANCPLITDSTLSEISTNLVGIRSLDVCGCSYITDAGVRALARCCHKLELLDLSSTGTAVTSKSIIALSNYCSQSLLVLKLSFCSDISVNTVNQVVKNCKKLTLLHLYGCKRIKEPDKIKNIRPNLVIER